MPVIVNTCFASLDHFNAAIRGGEEERKKEKKKEEQAEDRSIEVIDADAKKESDDVGIVLRSLRNAVTEELA